MTKDNPVSKVGESDDKTALVMQKHLQKSFRLLLSCDFSREIQNVEVEKKVDGSFHVTLPLAFVKAINNLPEEKGRHLCGRMLYKWKHRDNSRGIKLENEWADIAHITHASAILMSVHSGECRRLLRIKEFVCGNAQSLAKLCREE